MANAKITDLTELTAVQGSDVLPIVDTLNDQTKKVTVTNVVATCLLYTSPSPRDGLLSRMPSSA